MLRPSLALLALALAASLLTGCASDEPAHAVIPWVPVCTPDPSGGGRR